MCSNSTKILKALLTEYRQKQPGFFNEKVVEFTKVLGLKLGSNSDVFVYQYQTNPIRSNKHDILSKIKRIYDFIILLASVTTHLKKLIKYLLLLGFGCDDLLPQGAINAWRRYYDKFPLIA